ncbi:M61 family metallopeptidase [Thermosynechococcaceae cyanobacterium BACA0444]|uniref:M61 family metallopeptidase n=1 Tax=Pseudocalidococcus azoricus BACA0444 TaxID=2918990 RepID=A0AAE4FNF0_9CYAN|nr:M61 family metallopeptidase [Pseudocalidococcus azoricus]MDS3859190.1 M61 family metallopeptidase [Pseudocalidococcus azoricus BACA0444]
MSPSVSATSPNPASPATPDQCLGQQPGLEFVIGFSQPWTHLFEVMFTVTGWQQDVLDLKMPVWTPGSYLVRDYARHVQDFVASSAGQPLQAWKCTKNHWQIATPEITTITIAYRVYAHELTVRTNHLDATHAYFNPAALCVYVPGLESLPITIRIQPPPDWHITTALPPIPTESHTFLAADYDTLVDSPFEIGTHRVYDFRVLGKDHRLAVWGEGNFRADRVIPDLEKIITLEAKLFDGLPYPDYTFILHLTGQGYGGLEHQNSCSLIYNRFGFVQPEAYQRFLGLVAHEFFHLWNVKRIRPQALASFDYDQENYTHFLWFCEGVTSYYDQLIPLWAGLYDQGVYFKLLSDDISRYLTTPGRLVQSLHDSSFDTWIKLYRPDANSPNSQMSYYLKGALVTLLLDLKIRAKFHNQRNFNQVMEQLWQDYRQAGAGFTPDHLWAVISEVAGEDFSEFEQTYIQGTVELDFNPYLEPFGLELRPSLGKACPYTGITLKTERGLVTIKTVDYDSPGQRAGLAVGDELVALNGWRIGAEKWSERLQEHRPGDEVAITVFHQDQLRKTTLTLATPQPSRYDLGLVQNPTPSQQKLLQGWLTFT